MDVVLGIFVVAGIVVALTAFLRPRRPGGPPPGEAAIQAAIPTFRVVALGLPGSGKTLLLASMFNELQTPSRQCYYLSAGDDDVARLTGWFAQMADTSRTDQWPRGTFTSETRRFTFGVKARSGETVHEVLRLDLLEYAGELLTDAEAHSDRRQELFEQVRSAHALLAIIDGARIRQHLDGDPQGWTELHRTLNILVPHLIEAGCPVTFVITKWDLLTHLHEDENTRLSLVRDLLMSNTHFRTLARLHSTRRVTRLIPVSAVGPGFASLDATGHVIKTRSAQARPTYVDVPLSTVVPDLFDQAELHLPTTLRAALHEEARRHLWRAPLERVHSTAMLTLQSSGRALLHALGSAPAAIAGDVLIAMFLDSRAPAVGPDPAGPQVDEAQRRVGEFVRVRKQVLQDMRGKPAMLEGRLPSSRLSQES
ncbi:hypothetical protein GCM10009733_060960 [Nonomuraea maheshkhaliensis]|uniref:Double-GTPase 2 domain-containing protein n=1 Tax=Nonomuraea maheshkhaliensis TaxID=419590 RepID=A0ABN2FNW6_9ACTN